MPQLKPLSSLTLVLSDVTIAFVVTLFLITVAPSFAALGMQGFVLMFILTAGFVAFITVVSLYFAQPAVLAKRVIAARDLAIHLRERALNEHTIVSVSNPDGRVAAVNQNFIDSLGYDADEVIGQMPDFFYWNPGDGTFEEIRSVVSAGETWKGKQRLRTRDGRCMVVETTVIPRFDDAGRFENSISIRTDLSHAMAEGAAEGRNSVVEALPDEVYIYDPQTFRLSYANENGRKRLRCSLPDLEGRDLLAFFNDDEARRFKRHVRPVLNGDMTLARLEIEHRTGLLEVLTHIDEAPNGTRSLVSVVRDISERKRAEEIKLSSVATISHELRTPLTSIKGALRLMESGVVGKLGPEVERMVNVARRNSDRLLSIVNDILILEKLSSGEMSMAMEPVDLRALLEEAAEVNAAFAAECAVSFEVDTSHAEAWVSGDPDRLMQVMSNLMSNAAKFSPEGSVITLGIDDRHDIWRVSVTDKGPGIPEAARKTLFDSFTQVNGIDNKNIEGTGLGLAICREIVMRHGGHIAFVTEVGEGSTFYFELDKQEVAAVGDHAPTASVA